AYTDGVPAGRLSGCEFNGVRYQSQARAGRKHERLLRYELLQAVVLDGAAKFPARVALVFSVGDIHGPYYRSRRVDRHRSGDFFQVDLCKQPMHVVKGVDCHAAFAALAPRKGGVRIVSHKGREVESGAKAGFAVINQIVEPLVRVLGSAKPGEHAHGPEPGPIHGALNAPGERVPTRKADLFEEVLVCNVRRSVKRLHL